jgi:phosphate-selective porin OprO/OprP
MMSLRKCSLILFLSVLCAFTSTQAQDTSIARSASDFLNTLNDTTVVKEADVTVAAPPIMEMKWNQWKTKYFTMNLGFAFLLDHNSLGQDANSITQVGKVDPATEFRGERIVLTGNLLFFKNPWKYMFSANFNGLDAPQGKKTFDFIDWSIDIPLSQKAGWITVGKQKEGVGHEYLMPGTQSQFMERGMGAPMLIRQRNIGIRYSNSILEQRMTYTIGFFNNYWETGKSFSDNGSQVTARVSYLPVYESDRKLMHVAVGFRHTGATEGKLSYKAKPEANTAPSYINTGSFDAKGANTIMLEWIGVNGPVTVVGEYMNASVNSSSKGNPNLSYFQIGGSWFATGENRRYNRMGGHLGKLVPKRNFKFRNGSGPGAIELGSRFTRTDANSQGLTGGTFSRFTMALGWFPNAHFRYEINYGRGRLDKDGIVGKTNFWQLRAQFEL